MAILLINDYEKFRKLIKKIQLRISANNIAIKEAKLKGQPLPKNPRPTRIYWDPAIQHWKILGPKQAPPRYNLHKLTKQNYQKKNRFKNFIDWLVNPRKFKKVRCVMMTDTPCPTYPVSEAELKEYMVQGVIEPKVNGRFSSSLVSIVIVGIAVLLVGIAASLLPALNLITAFSLPTLSSVLVMPIYSAFEIFIGRYKTGRWPNSEERGQIYKNGVSLSFKVGAAMLGLTLGTMLLPVVLPSTLGFYGWLAASSAIVGVSEALCVGISSFVGKISSCKTAEEKSQLAKETVSIVASVGAAGGAWWSLTATSPIFILLTPLITWPPVIASLTLSLSVAAITTTGFCVIYKSLSKILGVRNNIPKQLQEADAARARFSGQEHVPAYDPVLSELKENKLASKLSHFIDGLDLDRRINGVVPDPVKRAAVNKFQNKITRFNYKNIFARASYKSAKRYVKQANIVDLTGNRFQAIEDYYLQKCNGLFLEPRPPLTDGTVQSPRFYTGYT